MTPFLFALAVGRLVPILLATTAVLVLARLCADKVGSSARMNRVLFGAILAAGLVAQVPYGLRSLSLWRAEYSISHGNADRAARAMESYRDLGGTPGAWRGSRWMGFLVKERRWRDARDLALALLEEPRPSGGTAQADLRLTLGISQYYLGDLQGASASFRGAEGADSRYAYLARYFEGRVAERSGQVRAALEAYAAALSNSPRFGPALYQLVRLLMAVGQKDGAAYALGRVLEAAPAAAGDILVRAAREHLEAGTVPPEREFEIVLP
jgi:tetratricopeptide (TPR) repeat protein